MVFHLKCNVQLPVPVRCHFLLCQKTEITNIMETKGNKLFTGELFENVFDRQSKKFSLVWPPRYIRLFLALCLLDNF